MDIALTPDLEALIHDEVESGRYTTPAEVVREALRLFRQSPPEQELDVLRRKIRIGLDDLENGAYTDYDEDTLPQLVADIKARGLERLKAGQR